MTYPLTHRQYYEGLKAGKLLGLKCKNCGSYTVPPKICCAECGGTDVEVAQLSGRGEIRTFTVIRVAPEGFKAPYIVALAELEEGPWLMGNVDGLDPANTVEDITGKKVKVGHRVIPPTNYTAGEGVAVTFLLE
ncbi:Zn-ribbon domain-containing OB-fold protein [Desulfoscipio geothermicus]|uniref:DUF35 domain-containing protein n=1 Tax=Desulfoscipio geothermicus DSM 3669 TaxID=1121426 RepID=A0A1I6CQF3_9FIRM|nr:Zn-ribbon domain-containing OB-fold protein [Desulfoscipio geothermicus]SFQ95412.1 hypothetical protein SAMN05660706_101190 [Desulfoscipio geothermicus DSM 3669]